MEEITQGTRVGRLVVLGRDYQREEERRELGKRHWPYYKCRCDCGLETSVIGNSLLSGRTQSCGCLRAERMRRRGKNSKDLSQKQFGDLTVIEQDTSKATKCGKHMYWICSCNICGNTKSIRSSDLISGYVVDCGCRRSQRASKGRVVDLEGAEFGHLSVLERDLSVGYRSGKHARWNCRCDLCGAVESVSSSVLIRYGKDRCSVCAKTVPMGELKIMELLDELNLEYIHDTTSLGCRYPDTDSLLYFDFIVNPDSDSKYIIEFDGVQHFKEVKPWERSMPLTERRRRDAYKNKWCDEHGIPMIRIPYTALKNMCVDDVNILTSSFVIEGGGPSA